MPAGALTCGLTLPGAMLAPREPLAVPTRAPPVGAPELAGALEPDEAPAAGLPAGPACGAQALSSSDAPAVPTSVPVAATLMKRRRLIWRRELSPSWFESGRLALSIAIE